MRSLEARQKEPIVLTLRVLRVLLYLGMVLASLAPGFISAQGGERVYVLRIDGAIDPNSGRYLERGLRLAGEQGAALVVLEIDTPGGLVSAMRGMIEDILASPVPVVTYVSPAGAQAASAGAFIAAAGHIAAMAPGTNIGASTPVSGSGEDLPETLSNKATNDAAALIRSVAEARGRNVAQYEAMVRNAASFTVTEAVAQDIVDLSAADLQDLLQQVNGRAVQVSAGQSLTLSTAGVRCAEPFLGCAVVHKTPTERFLAIISDPNIAAILLTLGGLGLVMEFLNPGLLFPGIFGVILLALAFVALGNLPVNWAGVGLILFALVLFFLELQVSGVGVLGAGAVVSLLLGLLLLFSPFSPAPPNISAPRIQVSWWLVGAMGGLAAAGVGTLAYLAWRGRREPPPTAISVLVGMKGRVTRALDPVGEVYVAEQHWTAEEENRGEVMEGEQVEVVALDGLVAKVRRVPSALSSGRPPER
jgi:membrane-bound serine protease (ClpP class)